MIVRPEGKQDARLILLGEAPGRWEAEQGRPFVGPAGSLLNNILQSAGLQRVLGSDLYITNVLKEKPPDTARKSNDISSIIDLSKKQPITSAAWKEALEELEEELSQCSSSTIVAFGNIPLYALTGIFPPKITKRRGSVYPCEMVPGKKVVATIHPAACLHGGGQGGGMYIWQHFILHDVKKAVRESQVEGIIKPYVQNDVCRSFDQARTFLLSIIKSEPSIISVDIEVVSLQVNNISICIDNYSLSIPFMWDGQEFFSPDQEVEIWIWIAYILENRKITKIAQHVIFDTQFIFRSYGIITKNTDDTMIAHAVLIPDFPKGLDFINSIYGDEVYYKDEGKLYLSSGGSDENFAIYNSKDSGVCTVSFPKILDDLRILGNEEAYEFQRDLVECLLYMSERGIRMDVEGLEKESKRVGDRIEDLGEQLNRMVGYEINPNSPAQLAEYFYEKKRYNPYKKRGTGRVTTDEDALKRLSRKGAPEASILLEIRRLAKLKGTYLDVTLDKDSRLRCSYNPVGAADSGRLSSSKTIWGTGMNLQNDPPEFKRFMLFDEGYAGYNVDLGQAENRIVAYIAPEGQMIDAFENGIDVHAKTASLISRLPVEDIIQQDKDDIKCPLAGGQFTWRFWGKKANHGLNYGLGYTLFAFYYEIPEREAKFIISSYHNAYPGVEQYQSWIQEQLGKDRTITNLFGRNRLFMDTWGKGLFGQAYSFIPQSTVADKINRHGLLEVYGDQQKYHHVELLNQVHDSIVFQIPLSIGWQTHADILLEIKKSLERPLQWRGREFVIPADLQIGRNMKDMEEVKWSGNLAENLRKEWNEQ